MAEPTKTCSKCGLDKPLGGFYPRADKLGLRSPCKACTRAAARLPEARAKSTAYLKVYNATQRAKNAARERILKQHAFTTGMLAALLDLQGGKCAICERPLTGWRTPRCASADHDHLTNTPRGVLCMVCNTALGKFDDSVDVLQRAIAYLKNPPALAL